MKDQLTHLLLSCLALSFVVLAMLVSIFQQYN